MYLPGLAVGGFESLGLALNPATLDLDISQTYYGIRVPKICLFTYAYSFHELFA